MNAINAATSIKFCLNSRAFQTSDFRTENIHYPLASKPREALPKFPRNLFIVINNITYLHRTRQPCHNMIVTLLTLSVQITHLPQHETQSLAFCSSKTWGLIFTHCAMKQYRERNGHSLVALNSKTASPACLFMRLTCHWSKAHYFLTINKFIECHCRYCGRMCAVQNNVAWPEPGFRHWNVIASM